MLKKYILTVFAFGFCAFGFAQNSLKGTVFNEDGEPLVNATVVLLNPSDSILKYFGITNSSGMYQIRNIKDGNYLIQYSFVGATAVTEKIAIPSERGEDLGKKVLYWKSKIDEVTVVAEYVPIKFRSDTVEFNVKAYNTKPDAVVEDLLKKIPGLEVDLAGNIKALGEEVVKVLVDGKEFFGRDKKVATKNLPADAVDKVEVFDKKSYEAEFTQIDDGVRDRTINLILKEDAKKGSFGDFNVGAGTDNRINANTKLYRFKGGSQIVALGMYNNVNEFGFASQDLGKFGSQVKGLNTTGAGGLNLSYSPAEFNKYYVSYLGSQTINTLEQNSEARYFSEKASYNQSSLINDESKNAPNSVDFGIHHRFSNQHNLIFTGNIDLIANNQEKATSAGTYNDILVINNFTGSNNQFSDQFQGAAKVSYLAKLSEGRTQIQTVASASFYNHFSGTEMDNIIHIYIPDSLIYTNQFIDRNTDRLTISINQSFVQKIGNLWYFSPELRLGTNREMIDQQQGNLIPGRTPVDTLSPDFTRENNYFETSVTFKRSTLKTQFNLVLKTAWNQLGTDLWDSSDGKRNWFNFLPSVNYENRWRNGRRFLARYASGVNIPSAGQLLPVYNTTNPLSLYTGNTGLRPEYNQNLSMELSVFDQFTYTTVFLRAAGSYTKDKISISQTIDENLVQRNQTVNVPWDYTASGSLNFSTPLRRLGLKLSLTISENWRKGINVVNTEDNILRSATHNIDLVLENNLKQKLNIRAGSSVSVTNTRYSIQSQLNNVYYNTVYFGDLLYNPDDHWNFQITARVTNFNSKSLKESLSIPMVDASVSYYFLEGNRAGLTLRGIDLIDRNKGFQQTSDINYLMQIRNNTIGRYIMLSFKYRLTAFAKK